MISRAWGFARNASKDSAVAPRLLARSLDQDRRTAFLANYLRRQDVRAQAMPTRAARRAAGNGGKIRMRGLLLIAVVVLFIGTATAAASAQNAPHRGDPRQGRRLAVQKCDVCHIVASDQKIPPLVPHYAPGFLAQARAEQGAGIFE